MKSKFLKVILGFWLICSIGRAEYTLVFEDNFDFFNTNNWEIESCERHHAINCPEAIEVSGGYLKIHAFTHQNIHYTGIISSKNKVDFGKGYFEVRAKFLPTSGAWMDWWGITHGMFENEIERRADDILQEQELDFFEIRKTDSENNDISHGVFRCIHSNFYKNLEENCEGLFTPNLDIHDGKFHVFGFLRDDDFYYFWVDHKLISVSKRISNQKFYMLFSIEIRDKWWAGNIKEDFDFKKEYFVIDYIRYYGLK